MVWNGVWRYANPTLLGVPLWFPAAFGTAALIGERLVRTINLIWEEDRSIVPRDRRASRVMCSRTVSIDQSICARDESLCGSHKAGTALKEEMKRAERMEVNRSWKAGGNT